MQDLGQGFREGLGFRLRGHRFSLRLRGRLAFELHTRFRPTLSASTPTPKPSVKDSWLRFPMHSFRVVYVSYIHPITPHFPNHVKPETRIP